MTNPMRDLDDEPISQRVVSARGAPKLVTDGARSVFDLHPKRPLNIDAIKVEKGVPIPPPWRKGRGHYDSLLNRLEVNDSAALPLECARSLRDAVKYYSRDHAGLKFSVRINAVDVRVWRTE